MVQQEVSVNCVVAWVGWACAIACAAFSLAYPDSGVTALSVVFTGGAAVLHGRGFAHGIADREANAFELGRDVERSHLRSMR